MSLCVSLLFNSGFVCWVSKLCLSVCLSEQVMFGMGFVCLSV